MCVYKSIKIIKVLVLKQLRSFNNKKRKWGVRLVFAFIASFETASFSLPLTDLNSLHRPSSPSASASQVLKFQVCATTPDSNIFF